MKSSFTFIVSLLTIFIASIAWAQEDKEPTPKEIKVSQAKFEQAVVRALLKNKAELHGIVACQNRCGSEPDEAGEVEYDKDEQPYTYNIPTSKSGGLVAIITAEKEPIYLHKYFVLPLPRCRDFLAQLRAKRKPVSLGKAPYLLNVEYGLLSLGKNKVDLIDSLCDNRSQVGSGESRDFEIQSIVGPVVNIVRYMSDASEGSSKASGSQDWMSWNLIENRRAELTDIFEKESVLTALKSDKVMRQRFFKGRKKELEQATELSTLMKAIEDDPRQSHHRMGWQINSYNPKTAMANVHMGFYGDCCNSYKIFKMGFDLRVKSEFQEIFQNSKAQGWIGLSRQENWERKKTTFERAFSTYVDLAIDPSSTY